MITLTYDDASADELTGRDCKRHLRAFRELLRRKGQTNGWILEFTARGRPHYHVFLAAPLALDLEWVTRNRRGHPTEVATMHADGGVIVEAWQRIAAKKVLSFDRGGIIERLRTPDAAGRYVAKEASKRAQKRTPEGFGWVGRWWGLSADLKPVPLYRVTIPDGATPQYKYIWDADKVGEVPVRELPRPDLVISRPKAKQK
jgi:hypothetical protein